LDAGLELKLDLEEDDLEEEDLELELDPLENTSEDTPRIRRKYMTK
jgi:hypothetical protein